MKFCIRYWLLLLTFLIIVLLPLSGKRGVQAESFMLFAGTGVQGYSGDGGPATLAQIDRPRDLVLDNKGNLLIAEYDNNCIRKVDPSGMITTFAGTGVAGYSGDGGPATKAQMADPASLAIDKMGNLYIADKFNNCIRKVDPSGMITTFAGTGAAGYSGDGGPATDAQLNWAGGICVDAFGNLFIGDTANQLIRKVDPEGVITTIAGTGGRGFAGDGGPATDAQLTNPSNLAVDSVGNLYVSSSQYHRVRKIDVSGVITTVAGTGVAGYSGDGGLATDAQLSTPSALYIDGVGNLYIADRSNNCVRMVNPFGKIFTVAGSPLVRYRARSGRINGIVVDASGSLFVSLPIENRVYTIPALSGAYTIKAPETNRYLFEQDHELVYGNGSLDPSRNLQFVWNITSRKGAVSIQNAHSQGFLNPSGVENATGDFALIRSGPGTFFLTQENSTKKVVGNKNNDVRLSDFGRDPDEGKWELIRVGPVQKAKMRFTEDPQVLDRKHVVLGFDGYMYRSHHEGYGEYRSEFRWLRERDGWLAASGATRIYREEDVFTIEYAGTWHQILSQQTAYGQNCSAKSMAHDRPVYMIKTKAGVYLQPEGLITQPVYRVGDPHRPIVHFSVGEHSGIRPVYEAGTAEREKAALFVVEQPNYDGSEWDGAVYLSAVAHQWRQPRSLSSEIKNLGKFLPVWGMVAPVSLYSLQACHDMHPSKPWPKEYPPPTDHGLIAYPLGVSIPLDEGTLGYSKPHAGPNHFNARICFTNNTHKDRDYNPYLGITTGWRYSFDVHPGSQVRLYVLDDEGLESFEDQAFLKE